MEKSARIQVLPGTHIFFYICHYYFSSCPIVQKPFLRTLDLTCFTKNYFGTCSKHLEPILSKSRLVTSRSKNGSFYVICAHGPVIEEVKKATGLELQVRSMPDI